MTDTQVASFWARVSNTGDPGACWPWLRARFPFGHGAVQFDGRQYRTHRLAWELTHGPIPLDLCVCHACDNPPCCNPAHLWLGTRAANTADRDRKGRTAHGLTSGRRTKPERTARGTRSGRAKIDEQAVAAIKAERATGRTLAAIAAGHGLGTSQVWRITRGLTWKALG